MKRLIVKELREALEGVPDELEVHFGSDTEEYYEIILGMARRVKYELSGKAVDYFEIYGNAAPDEDNW